MTLLGAITPKTSLRWLLLGLPIAMYVVCFVLELEHDNSKQAIWTYSKDFITLFLAIFAALKATNPPCLLSIYLFEEQGRNNHLAETFCVAHDLICFADGTNFRQAQLVVVGVSDVRIEPLEQLGTQNRAPLAEELALVFDAEKRSTTLTLQSFPKKIPVFLVYDGLSDGTFLITGSVKLLVTAAFSTSSINRTLDYKFSVQLSKPRSTYAQF